MTKVKSIVTSTKKFVEYYRAVVGSSTFTVDEFTYLLGLLQKYLQGKLSKSKRAQIDRMMSALGGALLTVIGLEACWRWYKNG